MPAYIIHKGYEKYVSETRPGASECKDDISGFLTLEIATQKVAGSRLKHPLLPVIPKGWMQVVHRFRRTATVSW